MRYPNLSFLIPTPYHKNERSSRKMYKQSPEKISVRMAKAGIASYSELSALSVVCANTIFRLNNGGSAQLATLRRLAASTVPQVPLVHRLALLGAVCGTEVLVQHHAALPVRLLAPFQFRIYGTLTDFQFCGNLDCRSVAPPHQFNFSAVLQRQSPHHNHLFPRFCSRLGKKIMQKKVEKPFLHLIYYFSLSRIFFEKA